MNVSGDILIVDDTMTNLQVLSAILEGEGWTVRSVGSGSEAFQAIDTHVPNLIILDALMPGMDGYEVCRRLKQSKIWRDIPVIFISSLNEIDDKLAAFHAGAVDYIAKPFQSEEVLARVHTQMELARVRLNLAETNSRLIMMMEQLVQAEKLKSLGSLAAGIAHELNTPVGNALLTVSAVAEAVHQFAQTPQANDISPALQDFLGTMDEGIALIWRNLDRASGLIMSLKDVAVDRASERRRSFNLLDTVNDVITLKRAMLAKTNVKVELDIDPDLKMDSYPGYLEHILENLIQNAVAHGFSGGLQGAISISAKHLSGDTLVLEIADNGKGIAPEHLNRVFDPFFTTGMMQGGSGLGLHIVYSLATGVLGGSISVKSALGQGTTFSLQLPVVASIETREAGIEHALRASGANPA